MVDRPSPESECSSSESECKWERLRSEWKQWEQRRGMKAAASSGQDEAPPGDPSPNHLSEGEVGVAMDRQQPEQRLYSALSVETLAAIARQRREAIAAAIAEDAERRDEDGDDFGDGTETPPTPPHPPFSSTLTHTAMKYRRVELIKPAKAEQAESDAESTASAADRQRRSAETSNRPCGPPPPRPDGTHTAAFPDRGPLPAFGGVIPSTPSTRISPAHPLPRSHASSMPPSPQPAQPAGPPPGTPPGRHAMATRADCARR